MKHLILVDACNVLHALSPFKERLGEGLDTLVSELLEQLRPLHDQEHWELHVIVDGRGLKLEQQFFEPSKTLSVIYSPEGTPADVVIESWLMRLGPEWTVRVATGDRAIIHTSLAQGAEPMSPASLIDWVDRIRQRFARLQQIQAKKSSRDFGNRLEGLL